MEEVAGGLGRALYLTLRWFVLVALFEIVLYWYGYGTIKLFTFGKYPQKSSIDKTLCAVLGFISLCGTLFLVSFLFKNVT